MDAPEIPPASHICRNGECDPICIWIKRHREYNARNKAKQHESGNCPVCGLIHTVPGAEKLNAGTGSTPIYDAMIRRTAGEADPLVKEPKK